MEGQTSAFEPGLGRWPQVDHPHVIKQRRAALRGERMMALQEKGHRLAAGLDGNLGMCPGILCRLIPGVPHDRRGLPFLTAGQVDPQRELDGCSTAHMFSPDFNLVAVAGEGLDLAIDAGFGLDKVKGELLGALATVDVGRVLVFMDAMCNSASL